MKKISLVAVIFATLTWTYGYAQMGGGMMAPGMMGGQQESMKSYQQQPSGTGGAAPGYGMMGHGMYPGYGMMGYGMGHGMMGYGMGHEIMGHCRGHGYGSTGYGMGHGMMGYGSGMHSGCDMMGYGGHMMGSGYGGHMHGWSGGYDQKFLDETVDLRKEIHSKKFDYFEAVRKAETDPEIIANLKKEIRTLKEKLHEKAPHVAYGRCW